MNLSGVWQDASKVCILQAIYGQVSWQVWIAEWVQPRQQKEPSLVPRQVQEQ